MATKFVGFLRETLRERSRGDGWRCLDGSSETVEARGPSGTHLEVAWGLVFVVHISSSTLSREPMASERGTVRKTGQARQTSNSLFASMLELAPTQAGSGPTRCCDAQLRSFRLALHIYLPMSALHSGPSGPERKTRYPSSLICLSPP